MSRFDAILFDLDGVLADTAHAHFLAWRRLARELGGDIDEAFNETLKGIDRRTSLDRILAHLNLSLDEGAKQAAAERKNGYYQAVIATQTPADLLPGAARVLMRARAAGLRVALASASRNAPFLLERLGIAAYFDGVADPAAVARPKPAPDLFLEAARLAGAAPARCLGVEDSQAGVDSIKDAGMTAIGIGDADVLARADHVVPRLADLDLDRYLS